MRTNIKIITILAGLAGLVLCGILSLAFGSRNIPFHEVMAVLGGTAEEAFTVSVVQARIPRTVFGMVAGGALGVSGALMQSITRNPIADPSILGVNTGASLFVVCGIAFFHINLPQQYIWLALVGGSLAAIFVYGIASMGSGGPTPIKLALAGAATSMALSSLVSTVMLPKTSVMDEFRFWQVGSIGGTGWGDISIMAPYLIVGFILAVCLIPSLNCLALGDEMAAGLGINTKLVRGLGALAGVVLCGATTALAGPIGFVGLMVPHLIRFIFGPDLKYIIPLSAIGGACLLTVSDVIGRVIGSPGELEVGIVTAFLGAPFFIFIARKAKVKFL
ncbi:FecCD family ABC transporter permease [Konateibacter massiliensis]|uniref:FecCD family ABC transporter permease n=1 Tax=Konateibacter massiliensis TaxID=2002841 RepID=UPI000C15BE34|nr:iron ABC transporter permease [Konateibacter massiliensis]